MAFGGVMFVAFPRLLGVAFSGYYLALFLVLWCLILRGISLEVGGHINDPMWQSFWDFVFPVSNVLLGFLFGTALGNVVRGVPLEESGEFHMAFFTDFGVRGNVGLLDWFSVSMGVVCMVMATAHGANLLDTEDGRPRARPVRSDSAQALGGDTRILRPDYGADLVCATRAIRRHGSKSNRLVGNHCLSCRRGFRLYGTTAAFGAQDLFGFLHDRFWTSERRCCGYVSRDLALYAWAGEFAHRLQQFGERKEPKGGHHLVAIRACVVMRLLLVRSSPFRRKGQGCRESTGTLLAVAGKLSYV